MVITEAPGMNTRRIRYGAALLLSGAVAGTLLGPSVVAAVSNVTGVHNASSTTTTAGITRAGQLLVTETKPTAVRVILTAAGSSSACQSPYTVPAGKAFIITEVIGSNSSASEGSFAMMATNNCSGEPMLGLYALPVAAYSVVTVPFSPGYAVASGGSISVVGGQATVAIEIIGYLVPATDAPTTTPIIYF
jgi:hypothetical protein